MTHPRSLRDDRPQPGSADDFIALCKAGSAIDDYITYEYTPEPPVAAGTAMLGRDEQTEPGSYVLRYTCSDETVAGESAPFEVYATACSSFRSMDYVEILTARG